jgi:hypothetical protein
MMNERNAMGDLIWKHWRTHLPRMVAELEKDGRLEQAILEAQAQTGDLLYELLTVRKMEYHAAWELAMREWAFLPSEEETARPSSGVSIPSQAAPAPPATSA